MEKQRKWHTESLEEIVNVTNSSTGLSSEEAQNNEAQFGLNRLEEEKKESLLSKVLSQFKDTMILILIAAAIISFFMNEAVDAIIILSIVVLNAIIGVIQEDKAEKALDALKEMSAPSAKVIRDGKVQVIQAYNVVPFDILLLEAGDVVAADCRLLETISTQIQESSLTGESVPVEKNASAVLEDDSALGDRINMAYASSMVTYGRAKALVVGTGMNTEVGKIAKLLKSAQKELTPLQKQLDQLGSTLGIAALIAVLVIFAVGLVYGKEAFHMFLTAISLAVAVIPESLPAVATIVLALGVQRLAKRQAIIRNLSSVETLGSATVICSDKTGTLTQNKMTVMESVSDDLESMKLACLLCNDSQLVDEKWVGDPTEIALSEWSLKMGLSIDVRKDYPRLGENPFDSVRKRMSTAHTINNQSLVYVKGGVDEILSKCTHTLSKGKVVKLTQKHIEEIHAKNTEMAQNALRVLAFAKKEIKADLDQKKYEEDLCFIGLVGMMDPAREEVKDAIKECNNAGIEVVMITGDHKVTAVAIAKEIGLMKENDRVLTGVELETMTDEELIAVVKSVSVYARVTPEHKIRIVEAWNKVGGIVAMTGDGVNDAPALKKADIGTAMGVVGTEVAKGASDMVLADDNFATIVHAIEEGRRIKDNILKSISYLLSCNVGELLTLMVATFLNWSTPLLPIHILWINLVTDSLPALALGVDPAEAGIMARQPQTEKNLLTLKMNWRIAYQGLMVGGLTLTGFVLGLKDSVLMGQTMAFAVLGFSQLFHAFNLRSFRHSIFKKSEINKWLIIAALINGLMMVAVLTIPALESLFKLAHMDMSHWEMVLALSFVPIPVVEVMKLLKLNGEK